jgi:hypothetical protein
VKRSGLIVLIAFLPAAWGCKASANAQMKTQQDLRGDDEPMAPPPPSEVDLGDQESSGDYASDTLVGARHDLQLAENVTTPTCNCLAVAVGEASDPRFSWESGPPRTTADQLVIALSSDGVSCADAAADSLGASYWGYKKEGDNIVVVVEEARFGRPITSGAIIPRPGPSGQVLIQPINARLPYGRALSSGDRYCRVAGATQSAPSEK